MDTILTVEDLKDLNYNIEHLVELFINEPVNTPALATALKELYEKEQFLKSCHKENASQWFFFDFLLKLWYNIYIKKRKEYNEW